MLSSIEIETNLRRLKPVLVSRFHVRQLGYFGSYATGHATEESDVDILVDFEKPIGWAFFDLQDLLEKELNRKVDLVTLAGLKEKLRPLILSQTRFV
ncbi:MAG: nucleotidyltransferase family protein [Cytophagaceae bacterium]|nr:nucleotidyltransferase family protein [Cytophagaceae bacterium]